MRIDRLVSLIFCLFVMLGVGAGAHADMASNIETANLDQAAKSLQQVETALQQPGLSKEVLQRLQDQLQPVGPQLQRALDHLTPRLAAQKAQLDQLGPAPAANAPAEAKDVAAERTKRQKALDDVDALVKRANLLSVQTEQALATIAGRLRARLAQSLLQQEPSLASPWLWRDAIGEMPANMAALRESAAAWMSRSNATLAGWRAPAFWSLVVLVVVFYWPVTRTAQHAAFRKPASAPPAPLQKILGAWRVLFAVAAFPIAAVLILGALAHGFGLMGLNLRDAPLGRAILFGTLRVAFAVGLAQALLAPKRREWRLLTIDDGTAAHVQRTILIVTLVVSCGRVASALGEVIDASWASQTFLRGLCALASAAAIGACLWIAKAEQDESEEVFGPRTSPAANWFGLLRTLLWAAVLIILAAVLAGYMTLSRFIVDQIVWVGGVGALAIMLVMLVDSLMGRGITGATPLGRRVMLSTGLGREAFEQAAILAGGAARVVIFLGAVLAALAPWGVQSTDVTGYLYAAFFGFKIGGVTISISRIVFTLLIFAAGFAATRVVERWLEVSFLPHTRLDIGLRNAIKTSLGYIGRIIAIGLALAYLGVDFAKLAIVAGALSVGIGFGLQSIVNNFVSGLILLWERVIRVGDWISVGPNEGFVRRINVRSTEIETFDRAAVVIPNSDLVAGVVKNFVRTDKTGRVKVSVPVNAAADPQKAREVLLDIAKRNKTVLQKPSPQVVFSAITSSAFNFDLYCCIDDVTSLQSVTSELNFEIHRRFKEEKLFDAPPPVMNVNLPELQKQGFVLREQPNGKTPPVRRATAKKQQDA